MLNKNYTFRTVKNNLSVIVLVKENWFSTAQGQSSFHQIHLFCYTFLITIRDEVYKKTQFQLTCRTN